jgi:hypothetical protein
MKWSLESKNFKHFRVPYTAANIIDLLKKIKNEPLAFPRRSHPLIEDVLRKMLVVDP